MSDKRHSSNALNWVLSLAVLFLWLPGANVLFMALGIWSGFGHWSLFKTTLIWSIYAMGALIGAYFFLRIVGWRRWYLVPVYIAGMVLTMYGLFWLSVMVTGDGP